MKLLIDINLSPKWVKFFQEHGYDALHWTSVGDPRASDAVIADWARERDYVIFTHDLDSSRIVALAGVSGPSVFQVRTESVRPSKIGHLVLCAFDQHGDSLRTGAIVVVDASSSRARILPI